MVCSTREVRLWADPKYNSSEVATSYSSRGRERELSASEVSRPQKKPRVGTAANTDPGTFSQKQLQKLNYEKEKMEDVLKKIQWTLQKANLPVLSDDIKKRDRDQLELKQDRLKATIWAIDAAWKRESGDFKEMKRDISATRSATNPAFSKLKQSVAEAEKDLDQEGVALVKKKMDEYEAKLILNEKKDTEPLEDNMDETETQIKTQKMDEDEVEIHV